MKDGVSVSLWRWQLWKITTCTGFSYILLSSPLQNSRHKITTSFLVFPLRKVFLLHACKLTSKRKPLCEGVGPVHETLTHSDCRCWAAGAHLKSATFQSEPFSACSGCRAARHTAPASCPGPALLMCWKVCCKTEPSLWLTEEVHDPRWL